MTRLIGLCSPVMGSGKTTLATRLERDNDYKKVSFAAPIKEMTLSLLKSVPLDFPVTPDACVYGEHKETVIPALGVTSRQIQQTLGTEWGRGCISETLWIDIALSVTAMHRDRGHSVVIDDVRFPNEYEAILAAGGECYRIVRPGAKMTTETHASEGQLDGIHMPEIWNTGSLEEFYTQAERIIGL